MSICHAASSLEHRYSGEYLIQRKNLAALPRGERSKQNDTLGYCWKRVELIENVNVMYG